MDSAELRSAFLTLSSKYSTAGWIEPVNADEHRSLLDGLLTDDRTDTYPAEFRYIRHSLAPYRSDWGQLLQAAQTASLPSSIRDRVLAEVNERVAYAGSVAAGDSDYSTHQRTHTGLPSADLVAVAKSVLDGDATVTHLDTHPDDLPETELDPAQTCQRIASALDAYGLHDWTVVEEPAMSAGASVNGTRRRVRVRGGVMFGLSDVDRLLAHEVGGHVLRWANSYNQPEPWTSVPLGRTVPTEEGLAAWREAEFGLLSQGRLRTYAARVVAVHLAQEHGIIELARELAQWVSRAEAVSISVRIKRGLSDPNSPGGATKDWGYLGGLLEIAELAQKDPSGLSLLSAVKWPVEDLALVRQLHQEDRVHPPLLLPDSTRLGLS